jgi:cytochrome c553
MRTSIKLSLALAALVLILGLPPAIVLTASPVAEPSVTTASNPLLPVLAARSTVAERYRAWEDRYQAAGGDRNVQIALGYAKGLSTTHLTAQGKTRLDLISGEVEVELSGLDGEPVSVWLVDNQQGDGKSVLPEAGDHMVEIGTLDGDGRLAARLGGDFFRTFELDLVVVSRAGEGPAESRLLLGTRPYFERLHTKTRVANGAAPDRGPWGALTALGSLFTPTTAEAIAPGILQNHLVSQQVALGADLFFRGTFSGNGRTCGTCHPPENNQEIGPSFISTLASSDPLFIAERSASRGGVPGLEIPVLMRQFGLILENVDGAENPTVKFTMRGVPHSLSQVTSILAPVDGRAPVERTGWSGDGAPISGALRFFPTGATFQHFTKSLQRRENIDFVFPTDEQLDAMEAFMLSAGRTNDLTLANVRLTNTGAESGRQLFVGGACNACHSNAGANASFAPGNFNFDTGVESLVNPAQAVRPHPKDGGFGTAENTPGIFGDGTFNTTPLVEAADTGPFFHNNAITTIEDAVAFYSGPEFNNSPSGQIAPINFTEQQNRDIAAFLRVINAAFNIDQARHRVDGAKVINAGSNPFFNTTNTILILAFVEADDAFTVLAERSLNSNAQIRLILAEFNILNALFSTNPAFRQSQMQSALSQLALAKSDLGTNMNFTIGEGNLLF